MEEIKTQLPLVQHLGIAYAPWSNGSSETGHQVLIRLLRSLCSQFRLDDEDLPEVTDLVVHFADNKPRTEVETSLQTRFGMPEEGMANRYWLKTESLKHGLGITTLTLL